MYAKISVIDTFIIIKTTRKCSCGIRTMQKPRIFERKLSCLPRQIREIRKAVSSEGMPWVSWDMTMNMAASPPMKTRSSTKCERSWNFQEKAKDTKNLHHLLNLPRQLNQPDSRNLTESMKRCKGLQLARSPITHILILEWMFGASLSSWHPKSFVWHEPRLKTGAYLTKYNRPYTRSDIMRAKESFLDCQKATLLMESLNEREINLTMKNPWQYHKTHIRNAPAGTQAHTLNSFFLRAFVLLSHSGLWSYCCIDFTYFPRKEKHQNIWKRKHKNNNPMEFS